MGSSSNIMILWSVSVLVISRNKKVCEYFADTGNSSSIAECIVSWSTEKVAKNYASVVQEQQQHVYVSLSRIFKWSYN